MGSPPKYSVGDEEQADPSHPLLGSPSHPEDSYPPTHTVNIHEDDEDAPSVIYFYNPPFPTLDEHLMGKLSRSKEDTITMIQSAITSLADVDRSRIHFHTLVNPAAPRNEQIWARVLDDVWVKMVQDRPHTLKITLGSRRENEAKRNRNDATRIFFSIGGLALGLILMFGLVRFFVQASNSTKSGSET